METSTNNKTSNKKPKRATNGICLTLSQKTRTSNEEQQKQQTADGNTPQKPKRATKNNKEHFSFPFSFICFNSGPMEGG